MIIKLINKIVVKRRHIIVEEEDLNRVLTTIHSVNREVGSYTYMHMEIGNCGWADEKKWYIHFITSEDKWNVIKQKLNIVRIWFDEDIPCGTIGTVYSTD